MSVVAAVDVDSGTRSAGNNAGSRSDTGLSVDVVGALEGNGTTTGTTTSERRGDSTTVVVGAIGVDSGIRSAGNNAGSRSDTGLSVDVVGVLDGDTTTGTTTTSEARSDSSAAVVGLIEVGNGDADRAGIDGGSRNDSGLSLDLGVVLGGVIDGRQTRTGNNTSHAGLSGTSTISVVGVLGF